jgi:hypothetical protein
MKVKVELTIPQIQVLRSIASDVFGADGPQDWSDLGHGTLAEASRDWRTLQRADNALGAAIRNAKKGASNA